MKWNTGNLYCSFIQLAICFFISQALAQELMYDPEKGIVVVDKNNKSKPLVNHRDSSAVSKPLTTQSLTKQSRTPKRVSSDKPDILTGYKKDPPEVYYRSGLEYYKNGDFRNALKNFTHANQAGDSVLYRLWIGKTYRQLGITDSMISVLESIVNNNPESDVADDALFELGHYYQQNDNYEKASQYYTQLVELYPFGVSYTTGEEFREICREQKRLMRAEMINILTILGYPGEDLPSSLSSFQKENHIEITGTLNQETVRAAKSMQNKLVEEEQRKSNRDQYAREYLSYSIIAGSIGLLNCFLLLILRIKLRNRKKQFNELFATLKDLDTKKI
jgi:tetratricopeptide (TPR) repeat protein